jgi:hypothetical protein
MDRLIPRDEAIFRYLAKRRVATLSQLQARFFPSYQTARKRLRILHVYGYLKRYSLPMGEESSKAWETAYCLSDKGRQTVAALTGLDIKRIPRVELDIKTRHTVATNGVLDAIGLDRADTEVPLPGGLIADALGPIKSGYVAIEVDRSYNDLRQKAARYGDLMQKEPLRLLVVTFRPAAVEKAFAGLPRPAIVVEFAKLQQEATLDWLRRELA